MDTVRLWGFDDELQEPVRSLLFGEMVRRAIPVMREYHSDLYHDARLLEQHLRGPRTFDWLIRPSGTNINFGAVPEECPARIGVRIGAGPGAIFYRITVHQERGMWYATFENVPLDQVASLPPLPEVAGTTSGAGSGS